MVTQASVVFGVGTPLFAILFGEAMDCFSIQDYDEALLKARNNALALGGVGLAFLLSMATQGWAFQTSGQRLAERVRISMFGNMLRHGIELCRFPVSNCSMSEPRFRFPWPGFDSQIHNSSFHQLAKGISIHDSWF